ncbi:MAG: hypothetical protein GKS06_17545 [Acidobacteria bacterium]|nr:hypothetical protein [Acidobacteriota bacterium]
MSKIRVTLTCLIATIVLLSPLAAEASEERMILQVYGEGRAKTRMIWSPDGMVEATCFAVDLKDVTTGEIVGRARDCLSDIEAVDSEGPSLALTGTTFFLFDDGDRIVARGRTSVQPKTTTNTNEITHITGAIPSADDANNAGFGVIARLGRGAYAGISGGARLSGAVNLSKLDSEGKISFDCIFILILDT